jgi:hypothetical protein
VGNCAELLMDGALDMRTAGDPAVESANDCVQLSCRPRPSR